MGAWNQALVLWKGSKCSYPLSHVSSPKVGLFAFNMFSKAHLLGESTAELFLTEGTAIFNYQRIRHIKCKYT